MQLMNPIIRQPVNAVPVLQFIGPPTPLPNNSSFSQHKLSSVGTTMVEIPSPLKVRKITKKTTPSLIGTIQETSSSNGTEPNSDTTNNNVPATGYDYEHSKIKKTKKSKKLYAHEQYFECQKNTTLFRKLSENEEAEFASSLESIDDTNNVRLTRMKRKLKLRELKRNKSQTLLDLDDRMRQWLSSTNNTYPDYICFGEKYLSSPTNDQMQKRKKDGSVIVKPKTKLKGPNLTINIQDRSKGGATLLQPTGTDVVSIEQTQSITNPTFYVTQPTFPIPPGTAQLHPKGVPVYYNPAFTGYHSPVFKGPQRPFALPNGNANKIPLAPGKMPIPAPSTTKTDPSGKTVTTSSAIGNNTAQVKVTGTSSSTPMRMVQAPNYGGYYYYPQMQLQGKSGMYPYIYQPPVQPGSVPVKTPNNKTLLPQQSQQPAQNQTKPTLQGKQPATETIVSPPITSTPTSSNISSTLSTTSTSQQIQLGLYYPQVAKTNGQYPMPYGSGGYFVPNPNFINGPSNGKNAQTVPPKFPYPPGIYGRNIAVFPQSIPMTNVATNKPTQSAQQQPINTGTATNTVKPITTLFKMPPNAVGRVVTSTNAPLNKIPNRGRGRGKAPTPDGQRATAPPLLIRNAPMPMAHISMQQPIRMMPPYGMVPMNYSIFPNGNQESFQIPHLSTLSKTEKKSSNQDTPIIIDEEESTKPQVIKSVNREENKTNTSSIETLQVQGDIDDSVEKMFMEAIPDEDQNKALTEKQYIRNINLERLYDEQGSMYPITFRSILHGKTDYDYYRPIVSENSVKIIPALIRRDYETEPLKKCLIRDLMSYHYGYDKYELFYEVGSIDYSHMQEWHLAQINSLLSKAFWPDIDMREYLRCPEHTVVALYKRLVIGCGFITSQGYISYLFTHPDWRRAGIGKFMLYQLVQSCINANQDAMVDDDCFSPKKDINDMVALHVPTDNAPAIALCTKFGFRQEAVAPNFYRYLLPAVQKEERQQRSIDAYFYQLKI
jgi:ribosomal protein S18 acetylase RimI-like enzyme